MVLVRAELDEVLRMSFILLDIDTGGAFWLLLIAGAAGLKSKVHELWFWVIAAMLTYLAFECIRAHVRQRRRKAEAITKAAS